MTDHAAREIVARLLSYGAEQQTKPLTEPYFTGEPEANHFVATDADAFLFAVIFDQGIKAERAWAAPFALRQRLGFWSMGRIAGMSAAEMAIVIAKPPALHRYVHNVADWLVHAARKLEQEYQSDASSIWNDGPTATDLFNRLIAFKGIGQKKAAMAVNILVNDLRVPVRRMEGSDIAFDVHIRRVFLRTDICERDEMQHMIDRARFLHPKHPGEIDFPTWLVGRQWCHPSNPDCPSCVVSDVCPKDIAQGSSVKG